MKFTDVSNQRKSEA